MFFFLSRDSCTTRLPYQRLSDSFTAGREEVIAFVWYEHQPCLSCCCCCCSCSSALFSSFISAPRGAPLRLQGLSTNSNRVHLLLGFLLVDKLQACHSPSSVVNQYHAGSERWQMPVLLAPLLVNRAGNGCLISSEWHFSPVQTICYHHVVMRAYIKQRKRGSMQTVVTLQPVVSLYIWARER